MISFLVLFLLATTADAVGVVPRCLSEHGAWRAEADAVLWAPAASGAVIRCDGEELEPLDRVASAEEAGIEVQIELRPARLFRLRTERREQSIDVEWLALDSEATRTVARRSVRAADGVIDLQVAEGAPRALGLHWTDGRRAVVFVGDAEELRLGPAERGGGVLAWLPHRGVRPAGLVATSASGRSAEAPFSTEGFAWVGGLAPGAYDIEARYPSGLTTGAGRIRVADDETVQAGSRMFPMVGGLELELPAESCAERSAPTRLTLTPVPGGWSPSVEIPLGHCSVEVAGLEPVDHRIEVGSWSEEVRVVAGDIAKHVIRFSGPVIEGSVRFGERPARGVDVTFTSADDRVSHEVRTDDQGRFEVTLAEPGEWSVDVRTKRYSPGFAKSIRVRPGRQRVDLALPSGRLTIRATFSGPDPDWGAQIGITGIGEQKDTFRMGIAPPPEYEAEFVGLPPGEYEISGSVSPDWMLAEPVRVVLDDVVPERDVEIVLERRPARILKLMHPRGEPFLGADIRLAHRVIGAAEEIEPGVYSIPASETGTLRIRARGYLAICRPLGPNETSLTLTMQTGPFDLVLMTEDPRTYLIKVTGLPGSTCPVQVLDLHPDRQLEGATHVLTLRGLPAGPLVFTGASGESVSVTVPAVAEVRLP